MVLQAKGIASRVVMDFESSFNTPLSANKKGRIIPFNTCELAWTRAIQQSATIRGNRNPFKPFVGNKDVTGNLAIPLLSDSVGMLLKATIGVPTTVEKPLASPTGSDINAGGTITIAGGSGGYTFSTAQTAVVGDRVIYQLGSGAITTGYITTKTDSTTGVLTKDRAGAVDSDDIAAATVLYICTNQANSSPGTVSLSAGTATFSTTHSSLAAGQMLIYDYAGGPSVVYVTAKLTATTATVVDLYGHVPADVTTKSVEWLGIKSFRVHTFKVSALASLPSFVLERAYLDLDTPLYEVLTGCKVDSLSFDFGSSNKELLLTAAIIGADKTTSQYDSSAVSIAGTKWQEFNASIKDAGVSLGFINEAKMTFANGLDNNSFVVGGGGLRAALPEGIADISGTLTALFGDTNLQTKADGATSSSVELTVDPGDGTQLVLTVPELYYKPMGLPPIKGPKGLLQDYSLMGFYDTDANASGMMFQLTNQVGAY